jgi:hypothetical protein
MEEVNTLNPEMDLITGAESNYVTDLSKQMTTKKQ